MSSEMSAGGGSASGGKYKVLGYVMLVLLLAAIVSVTLLYQVNHQTSIPGGVQHQEQNTFKIFTDPQGQFNLVYANEYILVTPDEEGDTYFTDPQAATIEIHIPQSVFPNTNFSESNVNIATDPFIKNAADCKKYSNGAASLKTTDKTEVVNGNNFDKAEFNGAAAGNFYETRLYRIFHGGVCYEINLTLHTTNIGNYPPGTVTEVNKGEAWSKLIQILNTFKFTNNDNNNQNDQSSNPQCGGIAGKICPVGQTCTYEGTYPDAGGNCIKPGNGVLNGHVDVGPLCPGPESVDMPCTTKPDYSATKILVKDSKLVLQKTLGLDAAGNYSVELSPGKYTIGLETNYGIGAKTQSQEVTIAGSQTSVANFTIDTGIR